MLRFKAVSATAAGASLLLASGAAIAAEEVGQAYIKAMGSYVIADDDRVVDDDLAGGLLGIGYAMSEHWNLELDMQSLSLDGDSDTIDGGEGPISVTRPDQDITAIGLNLMNLYNRSGTISPFLLAGIGVSNTDVDGFDDSDDFYAQGGAGALVALGKRVSLRAEGMYRWTDGPPAPFDSDDSAGDIIINLGLSFAIGSKPAPVAVAAPVAAAAAPPPPPPPPAPPADTDGDGVVDASDQCPDTPRGDRVGAQGCSCDVTRQLQFKFDSAELTAEDKQILDEVAERLTALKFVSGTVEGHTDSTGPENYNQGLSERRAKSAATYLEGKGIGGGRLSVEGFGETKPIADNSTKEGRAQNRRVVLRRTDCDAPR